MRPDNVTELIKPVDSFTLVRPGYEPGHHTSSNTKLVTPTTQQSGVQVPELLSARSDGVEL